MFFKCSKPSDQVADDTGMRLGIFSGHSEMGAHLYFEIFCELFRPIVSKGYFRTKTWEHKLV